MPGQANGSSLSTVKQIPVEALVGGLIRIGSIPSTTAATDIYFPTASQINDYLKIDASANDVSTGIKNVTGFKCTICICGTSTTDKLAFKQQHSVTDFNTFLYDNRQLGSLADSTALADLYEASSMDIFIGCADENSGNPKWNIIRLN